MAIVDERGRVYGRWNLLDLAVLIMLIGLVPLFYAGYLLFRDQPPTLVSITPTQFEESPEIFVKLKGTNLKPYMRVSAGTQQARDFFFKSTQEAEVPFASLPPGRYDIVLYDSAQERFRLRDALTIAPSPLPATTIVAIGAFGNVDAAGAARLTKGTELPGAGRIVAVGKAVPDVTQVFSGSVQVGVHVPNALRVPAIVEFNCHVRAQQGTPFCSLNNTAIVPTALMMVATPLGSTPFQVERVRGSEPVESVPVTLRVSGVPSVISRIKAGDVDMGGTTNELATQARVESVTAAPGGAIDVKLVAQLQRGDQGWLYESRVLRAGGGLMLRTADYEVPGVVVELPPPGRRAP
jgi:hypothetical protein